MMNRRTVIGTAAATAAAGTVAGALAGERTGELAELIAKLEQLTEAGVDTDDAFAGAQQDAHQRTVPPEEILLPGPDRAWSGPSESRSDHYYWPGPGHEIRGVMSRAGIDACRDFRAERHALLDDYERRLASAMAELRVDELRAEAEALWSRCKAAHAAIRDYRPVNFAEAARKLRWALEEHDQTDDPLFDGEEERSPVAEMVVTALADLERLAGVDR